MLAVASSTAATAADSTSGPPQNRVAAARDDGEGYQPV
jgi:hypothetical protein